MRIRAVTVSMALAAMALVTVIGLAAGLRRAEAAWAAQADQVPAQKPVPDGWELPPTADEEKNPLDVTPVVINTGKALFKKKCERCHGPDGNGDGPDADPEHMADMDLTTPKRADRNSDGVVFYKLWNGRKKPKMPAFKEELTKEQAWSVVAYSQTLRRPTK
ncbi:MAG: c-type cytochrome [Vicinamibacterales bacterium]